MFQHCATLVFSIFLASRLARADPSVLPAPGQPTKQGKPLTFEIVGNSGVSAQQMFLGTEDTVYIIDKTENNPMQVKGHPAWASAYSLDTNKARAMDVLSNTFCAGGTSLGDGRWINAGGNNGITWGGLTPPGDGSYGGDPYDDYDGREALRFLTPCDGNSCNWIDNPDNYMQSQRWYPTLETLEDGSAIIIGGDMQGGYVNDANQNNPTYEFYPSRGAPVYMNILDITLPANLYPLTWLLPSGRLFIQTNWKAEIFDYKAKKENFIADIPYAVRTYPASGATTMLPLTPANNYTATIMFCGGSNLQPDQWGQDWNIAGFKADASCTRIEPDGAAVWTDEFPIPQGRTMGQFILLPNGKVLLLNGGNLGTAGYGNVSWAIGQSYATAPVLKPVVYDPVAHTWTQVQSASTIPRLYHSSAILLPDGSVMVAGSNPNSDYNVGQGVTYPTEYRVERFYPDYYASKRPQPNGLLSQLSYGGSYFNVTLDPASDLNNDAKNVIQNVTVVLIRTGFSTHAMNMGQRLLQLNSTYYVNQDGSKATLMVSQLPPNPALFAPGPAVVHVVVNGVPSVGKMIMVGSGKIGKQTVLPVVPLPDSFIEPVPNTTSSGGKPNGGSNGSTHHSGAAANAVASYSSVLMTAVVVLGSVAVGASL